MISRLPPSGEEVFRPFSPAITALDAFTSKVHPLVPARDGSNPLSATEQILIRHGQPILMQSLANMNYSDLNGVYNSLVSSSCLGSPAAVHSVSGCRNFGKLKSRVAMRTATISVFSVLTQ